MLLLSVCLLTFLAAKSNGGLYKARRGADYSVQEASQEFSASGSASGAEFSSPSWSSAEGGTGAGGGGGGGWSAGAAAGASGSAWAGGGGGSSYSGGKTSGASLGSGGWSSSSGGAGGAIGSGGGWSGGGGGGGATLGGGAGWSGGGGGATLGGAAGWSGGGGGATLGGAAGWSGGGGGATLGGAAGWSGGGGGATLGGATGWSGGGGGATFGGDGGWAGGGGGASFGGAGGWAGGGNLGGLSTSSYTIGGGGGSGPWAGAPGSLLGGSVRPDHDGTSMSNGYTVIQGEEVPDLPPSIFEYKPHFGGRDINTLPHIIPPGGKTIEQLQTTADLELKRLMLEAKKNQDSAMDKIKKLKKNYGYGTFGYDGFKNPFKYTKNFDLGTHRALDLGTSIDYKSLKGRDGKLKLPVQTVTISKTLGIHVPEPYPVKHEVAVPAPFPVPHPVPVPVHKVAHVDSVVQGPSFEDSFSLAFPDQGKPKMVDSLSSVVKHHEASSRPGKITGSSFRGPNYLPPFSGGGGGGGPSPPVSSSLDGLLPPSASQPSTGYGPPSPSTGFGPPSPSTAYGPPPSHHH